MNQSRRRFLQGSLGAVAAGSIAARSSLAAQAKPLIKVAIRSNRQSFTNLTVQAEWPSAPKDWPSAGGFVAILEGGSEILPAQWLRDADAGKDYFLFLVPAFAANSVRTYEIRPTKALAKSTGVRTALNGENVDIFIGDGNQLFTTYRVHSGPNKPSFFPILTPEGSYLVRHWPNEPDADPKESHDHPHHRGMWFTHSSVNGVDFWSEVGRGLGKTVNTGFKSLYSGEVAGGFQATTDWHMPDDSIVARDIRTVRFYLLPNGDRLVDFEIKITPNGGDVTFGDNKDGMFGLRLPDSLAVNPSVKPAVHGTGNILNSAGDRDAAVWSKKADWVDYWGPIAGKTYGVAIMDHPTNLRHPETWHARDYGLFTVNPFGLHDFGQGPKGIGDYKLKAADTLSFRYRLLFHKGDAVEGRVAEQYAAYGDPPEVTHA